MSGVRHTRGPSLSDIQREVRELPATLALEVAKRGAAQLTRLARNSFASGQTVYGDARPDGTDGSALDLVRTGATLSDLRFVAVATRIRARLGPRYARFLVGKYRILPSGSQSMPVAWARALRSIVSDAKVRAR